MLLAGVAIYLLAEEEETSDLHNASWSSARMFAYLTCLQTLVISSIFSWIIEIEAMTATTFQKLLPFLLINLVATALTIGSWGFSLSQANAQNHPIATGISAYLSLSGLIACAAWLLDLPSYSTPAQLMAFLFASLLVLSDDGWALMITYLLHTNNLPIYQRISSLNHDIELDSDGLQIEEPDINERTTPLSWAATASLIICLWTSYTILTIHSILLIPQPTSPPHLRTNTTSPSQLDIVISMYSEPPLSVQNTISSLLAITNISTLDPRVIIYTKLPTANTSLLASQTGADSVIALPNIGRESETFLHHILTHWSALAIHTIFLQASPHKEREMLHRIEDFFVPSGTGYLPLADTATCACGECGDRHGWSDDSGLIEDIFSSAHGRNCTPGERIMLSYKGQFIASSARIRGAGRQMWDMLRDLLVDESSWAHGEAYLGGREDSMSKPVVGYTVERMWGVALGCNDEWVGRICPSLLSGWRRGGGRGDCQCFD